MARMNDFAPPGLCGTVLPCAYNSPTAFAPKTISQTFSSLKETRKIGLILYITAGDPNLATTAKALTLLDDYGADIIELVVHTLIHLQTVLSFRLLPPEPFEMVIPCLKAPVVLFTYYNPILKRGVHNFVQEIKSAGVTGLLVPDLPLEETDMLRRLTLENGIELVLLATPTTPKERMREISQASQGFVYLVSLTGVTGVRTQLQTTVQSLIQDLKQVTNKPIAVGFGISKPEHAIQISQWGADGVIIGSAMVKLLGEAGSEEEGLAALKKFMEDLRLSIDSIS